MSIVTIKDNNGIEKEIPCIKAANGKPAFMEAKVAGFQGTEQDFCKNLAEMDNPYCSVGAIYYSYLQIDPGAHFGGTWEQIKDTFILYGGSVYEWSSTDKASNKLTSGGSAAVTLTIDNLPSHYHTVKGARFTSGSNMAEYYVNSQNAVSRGIATGGGGAHGNMPPYVIIYAWRRIG